jgi:UPF0271 protein
MGWSEAAVPDQRNPRSSTLQIDLNCDMGESFGVYQLGNDEGMMRSITSANIACGFHAGDPMVMDRTTKMAVERGVRVGAHPGYPDLLGFGRRTYGASPSEVEQYVLYQIGALSAIAKAHGARLQHVAPHGALGNLAAEDLKIARAVAGAVAKFGENLILLSIAGTRIGEAGKELGLRVAEMVLLDRNYRDDGMLVPRSERNAIIHDRQAIADRALDVVRHGRVVSATGRALKLRADTLTLHGDNPEAVENAEAVVTALRSAGIHLQAMSEFL